ncbi:MAG: hypothetical protein D6814_05885 [Calditrichaeota bacterium]|nr:MAG: hypothetical protein D6814_05885 [Calditrichota bacterium]
MADYIEIKFKGERTGIFANPMQFPFQRGDLAIVEAEKGIDLGRVNQILENYDPQEEPRKILRKASEKEILKYWQLKIKEEKAIVVCQAKVQKHKLDMVLVDCEFQFDGNKVTFYFTSEQRVDFRELVKDLAAEYRTRIELRQIGVRDAAKRLGGFGVCGRKLCCSAWVREFKPITTQAAKDQNLPLNPNRLAGVCGRLKCCLMYERDFYNWAIGRFPELAKEIETEKGSGIIERIDILKETVQVKYDSGVRETLPLSEVQDKIYKCENDCGFLQEDLQKLNYQTMTH